MRVDALWLTGGADAALALARGMAGGEPPGIAAARAARDGSLPAGEIAHAAAGGVRGATAFERCSAITALIACDELDVARRALATCTRAAAVRGAGEELALLERLRVRLSFVEGAVAGDGPLLAGPDPGPDPWQAWCAAADGEAVKRFGTPSARAAALLVDARGIEAIELAVTLLRGSPRRAQLAQALLTLGRALRRSGRRRDARVALTEAVTFAQRLGNCDLARDAHEELRIAGARPRRELMTGPASLTAAERRVADAAGASNREIAQSLFVSPKTVEMHLGRVYRKLNIGSRGDLPGVLGDRLAVAA